LAISHSSCSSYYTNKLIYIVEEETNIEGEATTIKGKTSAAMTVVVAAQFKYLAWPVFLSNKTYTSYFYTNQTWCD